MTALRAAAVLGLFAAICLPGMASAMSLPEAIALAQKSNPTLARSTAQADAADARLSEARAGRLPTVVLSGESGWGTTDLGGFFGFGRSTVSPRGAALEVRLPLFAGGAIRGGQVVGASDETGSAPADRPVNPSEIAATVYKGLGIELDTELPGPQGRPIRLVDSGSEPISELFS